jgi:signal transduction histidine kinase
MMTESTTLVIGGAVLALWLIFAVWAVVRGITMQRSAAFAALRAAQLNAMLDSSPSLPLLVRGDGRIEGPSSIAVLFGKDVLPDTLDALLPDIDAANSISAEVEAAQHGGGKFRLAVRTGVADRRVEVSGAPAPLSLGANGAALLWLRDATEEEHRLSALTDQRAQAVAAFEALSGVIEAAPFPMWFRDESLHIAIANSAYVQATEAVDAVEVLARQIELVEPIDGLSARDSAENALGEATTVSRLLPVTVGGARQIMQVVDVPIPGMGVAGYALNQQDLIDARAETRRFSEARRAMLDQMSAAVAEFAADRTLRFVNRPFLRVFGVTEEWAASAPEFERVLDKLRDNGRAPEVRDFPGWRAERRGWFAELHAIEESWLLRDGTHLRIVAHPAPDSGLLLIAEDRTEELRLAASRDTLLRVRTATFDNLYEAVSVFSPDGRLHLWNQRFRRLWNLSEEYLTTHPRIDDLLEKIAPQLENSRQTAILAQMIVGATGERQQRSGRIALREERQFDFSAIPLPDGNALFTLIDVSDSRRIEKVLRERAAALEDADRMKTDFLSRISYELRTPLTSISGFAEMLASGYAGDLSDTAAGYANAILQSTALLGQQIDTVLDLAQSEAGTLPIERRPLSLIALLRDALEAAAEDAAHSDVEIEDRVSPSLGQMAGDAKRLRQVFDHILATGIAGFASSNRVPPGGRRIVVHAEGNAQQARIIFSDNGDGAVPAGANAVAMALARQLVAAHDGDCTVIAEPLQGSMTTIRLPR